MNSESDVDLVARYLGGDAHGLAAIYDRYADAVYDVASAMLRNRDDAADATQDVFTTAAAQLHQLRDPSRLKPWLMAILRNNVYRRTKKRARSLPTDFTDARAELALAPTDEPLGSETELAELAELVRTAAAGLSTRDQLVLELAVRQQLQGDDLADALGVSAQQSYNLVHRMRQRTERALGAVCVARYGRRECDELRQLLGEWDGQFTVLVRKRVARHVDECATCEQSRSKFMPLALFAAAPALDAPEWLREHVLAESPGPADHTTLEFTRSTGFPAPTHTSGHRVAWIARASVAAIVIAVAVIAWHSRDSAADTSEVAVDPVSLPTTIAGGADEPPVTRAVATTQPTARTTEPPATTAPDAASSSAPATTVVVATSLPDDVPPTVTAPPVVPRNGDPLPAAPPLAGGEPAPTTAAPDPPIAAPDPTTTTTTTTTVAPATTTTPPDTADPVVTLSGTPTLDCSGFRISVNTSDASPASPQPSGVLTGPVGETYSIPFSGGAPWNGLVETDAYGGALGSGVFTWSIQAADAAGNVGTLSGSTTSTCSGM